MYHGTRPGWIEVISGVMFSGKSEELIRRVRRATLARRAVQVFKSHLDSRYTGIYNVTSHDGTALEAAPVDSAAEILRQVRAGTEIVAIDEAQFLGHELVATATLLAQRGVRVIVAGTDTDFRGEPFGAMGDLMAVAETVDKLRAICIVCGGEACRNQRLVDGRPARWDAPLIVVGGRETYEARCRHCHRVPRIDEDQTRLL
ncbi:MAG: thymidine kinase [Gemmatimonadales bacterium]|jgi:thymidine kinase